MATIKDVKKKIQNANALGIANLTEQGVELSADATTCEIMQGIAEIVSGGGSQYTSIVYNEDNTITLTDKDGVVHTVECEYTDGKLTSVKYDGKAIALFYDEDVLVQVGKTEVDVKNAPTTPSGAILNIAYGEEPPEDTSKLWIKANEPENVIFSRSVEGSNEISEIGNMPDNAYYVGCVPIGEKVYIMGGTNGSNNVRYITYYDTQTGTITVSATVTVGYSYGGYGSACGAVGTTIHYFSGYMNNYGSNKYARFRSAYDTLTDTKTGEEDSSIGYRLHMGYCTIDKNIYSFGGTYSSNKYNDVRVYDTEAGTISTLSATLPFYWSKMGCVAVGENIYLIGGYNNTGGAYTNLIYRFNISTQSLEKSEVSLPIACGNIGCAAVGSKIYIFGGENADGVLNTILEFDTETETIKTLENTMPFACARMGCVAVNDEIYLFGGYDGTTAVNTIQKFTLTQQLNHGEILVKTSVKNLFNIVNAEKSQIEIGVESVYIGNENNEAYKLEAYLHNGIEWAVIE